MIFLWESRYIHNMEANESHKPLSAHRSQSCKTSEVDAALANSRGQNPCIRYPLATSGWLLGLSGFHHGEDFRLYPGVNTVGAATHCDVVVTGPNISRNHVSIDVLSGDSAIVYPGHTQNITHINGAPCQQPTPLCHGDMLTVGTQDFIYVSLIPHRNETRKPILLPFRLERNANFTAGWLIQLRGDREGRDHRLTFGENRIGSQHGLEVVLHDAGVLSRHAVITRHSDNWTIVPVSVTEPLQLNGNICTGDVLQNADVLSFGNAEYLFRSLQLGWTT